MRQHEHIEIPGWFWTYSCKLLRELISLFPRDVLFADCKDFSEAICHMYTVTVISEQYNSSLATTIEHGVLLQPQQHTTLLSPCALFTCPYLLFLQWLSISLTLIPFICVNIDLPLFLLFIGTYCNACFDTYLMPPSSLCPYHISCWFQLRLSLYILYLYIIFFIRYIF